MAGEQDFTGQRLEEVDFSGAVLHGCRWDGTRITDGYPVDIELGGDLLRVVVNDVDVTQYVSDELDRRFPERVRTRTWRTVAEYRALSGDVAELWAGTVARAVELSPDAPYARVRGEWSMVETLRHLVFATDAWFGRAVLERVDPYHPVGLVPTGFDLSEPALAALDVAAQPPLGEVLAVRRERQAELERYLSEISDDDLDRDSTLAPYPDGRPGHRVQQCLGVIIAEEIEHRRYTERALALLAAGA